MHAAFAFKLFESIWLCKIFSINKTLCHNRVVRTLLCDWLHDCGCMWKKCWSLSTSVLRVEQWLIAAHYHLLLALVNTCHLTLQLNAGDCHDCQNQQAKHRDTKMQKWDVSWSSSIVLSDIRVLSHNHKQPVIRCLLFFKFWSQASGLY